MIFRKLRQRLIALRSRAHAWATPKEQLQAEIGRWRARVHALQCAQTEALSNALLFENSDILEWLRAVAGSDKGALGVQVKELKDSNAALIKSHAAAKASEAIAWQKLEGVLEAWELASGVRSGHWDAKKNEWIVTSDVAERLPQDVLDALKVWVNREAEAKPKTPAPRA